MLVFLTWSGHRSKAVAETFASWIGQVIQAVEPWISVDIEKGARWSEEIRQKLEESKVGIACLTHENLDARWLLFECGAIAKTKDARVCTLLLDIGRSDVEPPLGQFQHTTRDKDDILQLCRTINKKVDQCGERALPESNLVKTFARYWPDLSEELNKIASEQPPSDPVKRTQPEILQEMLEILRGQERRAARVEERAHQLSRIVEAEREEARRDREVTTLDLMRRHLEPNAALKSALATMNFDSVVSKEVARYLAEHKVGGVLSSNFAPHDAKQDAEEEKKPKGSRDEGEEN